MISRYLGLPGRGLTIGRGCYFNIYENGSLIAGIDGRSGLESKDKTCEKGFWCNPYPYCPHSVEIHKLNYGKIDIVEVPRRYKLTNAQEEYIRKNKQLVLTTDLPRYPEDLIGFYEKHGMHGFSCTMEVDISTGDVRETTLYAKMRREVRWGNATTEERDERLGPTLMQVRPFLKRIIIGIIPLAGIYLLWRGVCKLARKVMSKIARKRKQPQRPAK